MISDILVIGLNHTTAPVEIREKMTFPGNQDGSAVRTIRAVPNVEEAVILSTCNRSEIIAMSGAAEQAVGDLLATVGRIHGLEPESFLDFMYVKKGRDAVRHVFRVASGLDSMVLGEPQILGQVKDAYRVATQANATGPILNRLMHRAFFSAKRVRSETGVGRAAVSVAYAAVELAGKILGDLSAKTVMLIGAGEMAELAARHLSGQVCRPVVVINRTYETACSLAAELRGTAVPMERIGEGLERADVVITSTASCDPIIRVDDVKSVMRRRRYRPVFFIDIAIPRDVEPAVNDIDGVYLYNIDDLQSVVEQNIDERKHEALRAEPLIEDETTKFMDWSKTLDAAPTIVALKEKLEAIRAGELTRMNGKLSDLSPEQRDAVERITRSIINKIAHDPISFLKRTGASSKRNTYLDLTQRVFNLEGLPTSPDDTGDHESSEQ